MSPATMRRKPPVQSVLRLGPWRGVKDVGDSGMQDPAYLQDAINCWFQDPENGGGVWARPGVNRGGQVRSGTGTFDCLHSYIHTDGVGYLFAVTGGKVYRRPVGSTTWTDVTPGGVTIVTGRPIYAVTFNGEIIFTNVTSRPWRATNLTATPITGTNIQVDSSSTAWFCRGAPTVHGGKLFFIADTIGSTYYTSRIVWSEELAAATGYLQSGYTNSWDLIQTSSDHLMAIVGTNSGLYTFRPSSIGLVAGSVSSDFSTSSTHDAVSQSIGIVNGYFVALRYTVPPLVANGFIWFLDHAGRPSRFAVGSTSIEPLWQEMRRRIHQRQSALPGPFQAWGGFAYSPDLNKVAALFLQDESSVTDRSRHIYVFDADSGSYEGQWMLELASQPTTETPTAVELMTIAATPFTSSLGFPDTFVFGGLVPGSSTDWRVWNQIPSTKANSSSVVFGDNAAAMHMSITTHLAPNEMNAVFRVHEAAVEALPDSTSLTLDQWTPYGQATALSATGITGTDSIQSSHDHGIYRYGLNQLGRWWRGVFHWNVAAGTAPYAIERASIKVSGYKASGVSK